MTSGSRAKVGLLWTGILLWFGLCWSVFSLMPNDSAIAAPTATLEQGQDAFAAGDLGRAAVLFDEVAAHGRDGRDRHHAAYKRALVDWWDGRESQAVGRLDGLIRDADGSLLGEATALRAQLSDAPYAQVTGRANTSDLKRLKGMVREGNYTAIDGLKIHAPSDGLGALYLGKALLAVGELDDALVAFDQCAQRFARAEEGHKCRYKAAFTSYLLGKPDVARDRLKRVGAGPLGGQAQAFDRFLQTPRP
jgi:hypothetical protein